jgi:hypothetical protein
MAASIDTLPWPALEIHSLRKPPFPPVFTGSLDRQPFSNCDTTQG